MIKIININDIVLRLFNENGVVYPCHIENSPHYKLLCGEREPYDEYVKLMVELDKAKNGYMSTVILIGKVTLQFCFWLYNFI